MEGLEELLRGNIHLHPGTRGALLVLDHQQVVLQGEVDELVGACGSDAFIELA